MLEKKEMNVFFYQNKNTWLHTINPILKVLLLIFLFILSALPGNIFVMLFILIFILSLFIFAKCLVNIKKIGLLFILIGLMTFIMWLFFYQGSGDKILIFYKNSFFYAVKMSLRFILMLISGLLFLSITPLEEISDGLILLKAPYGIAFAISMSFRMVILFISTGFTIVESQKVRGNQIDKGGILKRIKSYIPLLIPLILNGIKKAENLTAALESKGFSPKNKINLKEKYKMDFKNYMTFFLILTLFIFLMYCKFIKKVI